MSQTHRSIATARRQAMTALFASVAAISSASAIPQVVPATVTPRAQAGPARARCLNCDSTRIKRELLAIKLDSLRTEFVGRSLTEPEREVLAREMQTTILALEELIDAGMRARFDMGAQGGIRRAPAPGTMTVTVQTGGKRGYLGVTFDGPMLADLQRDSVRFFSYPTIVAVDPRSPADRAGVLRGDTLIALNGTDVVDHLFSFAKLLVPDEKVTMKVRRQGDAKEFRIVVGEQPDYVVQRMPYPGVAYAFPGEPGRAPEPARVQVRTSPPGARAVVAPMAPTPAEAPTFTFFVNSVGGARLESLSEGLAKNIGIKGGVLVLRVAPGGSADQWGMREGDIILSADGETISAVREFVRVVQERNGPDGLKVVVLREKKQLELIVK